MAPPVAEASVTIEAPIDVVWAVMTDVARYREWNPFIVEVGLRDGALVLMTGMGAGLTWGSGLIEWTANGRS